MSGTMEQVYLPSDSRLDLLGEGHYSSWILINGGGGEGKMWALFQSLSGPLFISGLGPQSNMALE